MNKRDRYLIIVEWSEEDKCYIGSVPGWIGICCHSNDEQDAFFDSFAKLLMIGLRYMKQMAECFQFSLAVEVIRGNL